MLIYILFIYEQSIIDTLIGFVVSQGILLLSFLPALFFYLTKFDHIDQKKENRMALIVFFGISFILLMYFMPKTFSTIYSGTLQSIGFAEKSEHLFSIKSSAYSKNMFPEPLWQHKDIKDNQRFYIMAYPLFSFGDYILLCPQGVMDKKQKYLKNNLNNAIKNNDEEMLNHLRVAAAKCALLERAQVGRWDGLLEDKQKIIKDEL